MAWILVIILLVVLLLFWMVIHSYLYQVNRMELFFPSLPAGFDGATIFFISDIHRRTVPRELIEKIKQEDKIDLVLIGGDLVEKGVPLTRAKENLQILKSMAPTYFVWGNHDEKNDAKQLDVLLQEERIEVLSNRAVRLESYNQEILWLMGVDDACTKKDRLHWALLDTQEADGFKILLSHAPTIVKKIKPEHQIDLVLSGHTHGGQICIPFIGAITGAVGEWFPKQVRGLHRLDTTLLYISTGFGTSHLPLRLFSTPEVLILKMRKGKV